MHAALRRFFHLIADGVIAIGRQSIYASANQEVDINLRCCTEEFVNIAFSVPDTLSQRKLSFSSIGTRVGLIFFRALHPLNSLRIQNLIAANPSCFIVRLQISPDGDIHPSANPAFL